LIVGGYAVGYHGYVRATADPDIWIPVDEPTAQAMVEIITEFGFHAEEPKKELFLTRENVIQMGHPPFRTDILTSISGADFGQCYPNRIVDTIDGVEVDLLDLDSLRRNKRTAGRDTDKLELRNLPKRDTPPPLRKRPAPCTRIVFCFFPPFTFSYTCNNPTICFGGVPRTEGDGTSPQPFPEDHRTGSHLILHFVRDKRWEKGVFSIPLSQHLSRNVCPDGPMESGGRAGSEECGRDGKGCLIPMKIQ
jgi:hypothetical protein